MNSNTEKFKIRFEGISIAEANSKANRLRDDILDSVFNVDVYIEKENQSYQDAGSTLILILGTPAILALAKGISNYLSRDRAKITIEKDGKIVAVNISGDDAARIAETFQKNI